MCGSLIDVAHEQALLLNHDTVIWHHPLDWHNALQRTVTLCGMTWLPPFAVHGTHKLSDAAREDEAQPFPSPALRVY